MQPETKPHEGGRYDERDRDSLGPQQKTGSCTNKWSEGEVSAGARCSELPHRKHVKHEAQAVAQEAND